MGIIRDNTRVNIYLKNGGADYVKIYEGTCEDCYNNLSYGIFMCEVERLIISGIEITFYVRK